MQDGGRHLQGIGFFLYWKSKRLAFIPLFIFFKKLDASIFNSTIFVDFSANVT